MGDTKSGRAKKARKEETRQLKRELEEERERLDEPEPPEDDEDVDVADLESDGGPNSRTCHRRGCEAPAKYLALERYQEETGHGAVEAEALLCRDHVTEEHPTNLEGVYEDYVFRVEPLPGTVD
jgi:hypothetical protein